LCASVRTILIFKINSQEVKSERILNCSRAHRRCRKICKTGNIEPMKFSGFKIGPIREEAARNSAPEVH
jgi:hypothetical protein